MLDGDDWLETKTLEKYLCILSETDADMVATVYYRYFTKSVIRKTAERKNSMSGERNFP